jgi:hypothetical protein
MYSSRSDILLLLLFIDRAAKPNRDLGQLRSGVADGKQRVNQGGRCRRRRDCERVAGGVD